LYPTTVGALRDVKKQIWLQAAIFFAIVIVIFTTVSIGLRPAFSFSNHKYSKPGDDSENPETIYIF
jgi:hypothetical protein